MANKITCTCGHSWDKLDSSKKDVSVCHICGKDNSMKSGGWLDKFEAPQAQNGIEGTMGGLTDEGFNYNGAWGGPSMQNGGDAPQAQDGWLEKLKGSVLNPENWGVEDYSKEKDFNKAYSSAKKSGEEEFMYKGKRYNTKYAGTPRQEVGTYGADGKPVHLMDINHPSQVNLYPAFGKYLPGHVSAMMSDYPQSASVNYSSAGNNPYGLKAVKNKGERSYFVYGNDKEKLYNKAATLPSGKYYLEDKYTPSDWNLLTNNCADNVCDAFGIPRSKGLETPSGAVSKIKEKYPTIDVTGRTQEDYSNLVENLDQKDVLKNSDKLTSIYFSPDTENKLKEDIGREIQTSLRKSGYDLPKSYIKGNKYNVDKVIGDETLNALKDWKKKNKSLAMGGSLPGAVGFTYARTQGAAPANGKYTKKTKASAQNGAEMSFYQNGLDWKPRNISKNGAWLDKYEDAPQAQDGTYVKKPRTDMLTMDEAKKQEQENRFLNAIENQPVIQTPKGKQLTKEQIFAKNKQTAEAQGKRFNPETGAVTPFLSPSTARTFERAWENIVEPMIDIEMAMSAAPLVGKGLKGIGELLTEQTALRNAYKLNPLALKENPEMFLYRARPVDQNIDVNMAAQLRAKEAAGEPLTWWQKNLLNPQINPQILAREKYFGKWFEKDPSRLDFYIDPGKRNFADDASIEILRTKLPKSEAAKFNVSQFDDAKTLTLSPKTEFILPKKMITSAERFPESSWQQLIQEDKKFNTPHWLKGYKEVPKPTSAPELINNYPIQHVGPGRTIQTIQEAPFNPEFYYIDEFGIRRAKPVTMRYSRESTAPLNPEDMPKLFSQITKPEWKKYVREARIHRNLNDPEFLRKNFFNDYPNIYPKNKKQYGGPIVDPRGQWAHPGEITEISSPYITMEGVPYPVLGISNTGDTKMMYPGEDYEFDGESVTEYPIKKNGGWLDKYEN